MNKELESETYDEITRLCEQGNEKAENEAYHEAYDLFARAMDLVPEPIEDWEASTWILASMGDMKFLTEYFEDAHLLFSQAMYCPGAIGNEFLHLRLGQVQLELGNTDRAADELARAYMAGGEEIFEDEDPKYFAFIKTKMKGI